MLCTFYHNKNKAVRPPDPPYLAARWLTAPPRHHPLQQKIGGNSLKEVKQALWMEGTKHSWRQDHHTEMGISWILTFYILSLQFSSPPHFPGCWYQTDSLQQGDRRSHSMENQSSSRDKTLKYQHEGFRNWTAETDHPSVKPPVDKPTCMHRIICPLLDRARQSKITWR